MPVPTPLVEIGFDLTETGTGPFFRLDDPVKGKLDNTEWLLGGTLFYDVTDRVRTIAIKRGKNQALNQYDAGLANIVFNNNDRTFDPVFAGSVYFGQIIPKRQIRISSGGELQFFGTVTDWNLTYEPNGDSLASAACADAIDFFATQVIFERTNDVQKSGERLNTILSLNELDWPIGDRDIETGAMELGADVVAADTNALEYIRLVTRSEPGSFFIAKNGDVTYRDRRTSPTSGGTLLADDGSGIPYSNMTVEYGSELLYNEISTTSAITSNGAVARAQESVDNYGIFNLTRTDLLINNDPDLIEYTKFLANRFKDPEYRFKSVQLVLDQRTPAQQEEILALEIGDVVQIKFTPNGIAPAIDRYAEVISLAHAVDNVNHILTMGFSTLDFSLMVLDDLVFGKLDNGNALAF
tara:strand:- start:531 stop:1763 length:1233 start_codon:yes stop_codon:yes gene_type:complete